MAIGRIGAQHLLDCGFRALGYCGMDDLFFWSRDRRDSFVRTLDEAGRRAVVYAPQRKQKELVWTEELQMMIAWLESLPKPVGIMACNDDFLQCVIEACKIAKYRIPDDIALVGVGDDEMVCSLTSPPLSSIGLNTERGGYEAAEILDELVSGKKVRDDVVIEPLHVVARHSTDILNITDPQIAKAVRFIRQHARECIHVDDVLAVVSMSRYAFYKRFS